MFCSHCGLKGTGNYCSACGTPLGEPPVLATIVWEDEVRYHVLLEHPEVRRRLAEAASAARKPMSGEEFLELAEKALEPLLAGVPVSKVATLVQPLYARLGVRTSKSRAQVIAAPPGVVLVTALCSLATAGQTVRSVRQGEDGCVLEAELPSDWRALAGELILSVQREANGTRVEAAATALGQLYDWGKNQAALDRLFGDLHRLRAAA